MTPLSHRKKEEGSEPDSSHVSLEISRGPLVEDNVQRGGETVTHESSSSSSSSENHLPWHASSISRWEFSTATMALCMCTLTHSYLLISVFPYSGFMAIDLISGANEENAGSYAGLIASSFMIGRSFSSFLWGQLADIYGRTTVLYASLAFSSIFSILFGLAPTFAWAIVFRCLLGLGNGMIGTAKTAVSELAGDDESLETRAMGLVLGMWGWGFLLSPAISGALAEPLRQYPDNSLVKQFEGVLSKYPFILPNLVGVAFCLSTMLAVVLFVPETLPEDKRRSSTSILPDFASWCRKLPSKVFNREQNEDSIELSSIVPDEHGRDNAHHPEIDEEQMRKTAAKSRKARLKTKTSDLYLTVPTDEEGEPQRSDPPQGTMASLLAKRTTRNHLLVYWVFSFVVISVDEAFPLFCISKEAGLGLSEASIGKILSGSGLIFALSQYFVYAWMVDRFGLNRSIKIGSTVTSPLIALIPLSVLWQRNTEEEDELSWATYLYLCLVTAVLRVFCMAFFSSISIATNRTVPTSERASMNGLSMLGGSVFKAVGPSFAGFLVTIAFSSGLFSPQIGAFLIFFVIGSIALAVSICSFYTLAGDTVETEQFAAH